MAGELGVAARLRARPAARLRPRRLLPRAVDQAAEVKAVGTDEEWDEATEALRPAAAGQGPRARARRGRRRVLRPEDPRAGEGRDRPHLADVDDPARLPDAAALRHALRRRRQRAAPADHDPPRAVRVDRAVLRGAASSTTRARSRRGSRRCRSTVLPGQPTATTTTRSEVVDRLKAEGFRAEVVDGSARRARRAHPAGEDREGAVRARGRRRRRRERHGRREPAGERRSRARRARSTTFVAQLAAEVAEHRVSCRDESRAAVGRLALRLRVGSRHRARPTTACVMCNLVDATDDAEALVLERTPDTITVMNLYPYGSGHLHGRADAARRQLRGPRPTTRASRSRSAQVRALRGDPRRVLARRRERRREPRPGRGRGRARRTSTCTCCRAGAATRTS